MVVLVALPTMLSAVIPLSIVEAAYDTDGIVNFKAGDEITLPVDPEHPDPTKPIVPKDPPTDKGTGGAVSIDYGSKIKFGTQKVSTADKVYYALPDELSDGTKKPTYVQVTDKSGTLNGWKLTLSQPTQFKTAEGDELDGTQIKFTKGEIASLVDEKYKPLNVTSEIVLVPGKSSVLAVGAVKGTGIGTWVYRFGSKAADNEKAISLSVPGKTAKLAKQYSTKLVWSLENVPGN